MSGAEERKVIAYVRDKPIYRVPDYTKDAQLIEGSINVRESVRALRRALFLDYAERNKIVATEQEVAAAWEKLGFTEEHRLDVVAHFDLVIEAMEKFLNDPAAGEAFAAANSSEIEADEWRRWKATVLNETQLQAVKKQVPRDMTHAFEQSRRGIETEIQLRKAQDAIGGKVAASSKAVMKLAMRRLGQSTPPGFAEGQYEIEMVKAARVSLWMNGELQSKNLRIVDEKVADTFALEVRVAQTTLAEE